jgi:hypothetical protein
MPEGERNGDRPRVRPARLCPARLFTQPGPRLPSGGKELSEASDRGGHIHRVGHIAIRHVFTSRGRGTGSARPQAQRPPRGAGSYAKRATVGAMSTAGPSSPAGAAGLAPPDRRRSGPLGGQEATRSARPWGPHPPCGHVFTSRGRGTGYARPQAQRPPRGQGATRSARPWGPHFLDPSSNTSLSRSSLPRSSHAFSRVMRPVSS